VGGTKTFYLKKGTSYGNYFFTHFNGVFFPKMFPKRFGIAGCACLSHSRSIDLAGYFF
jgi:hypothetical protein